MKNKLGYLWVALGFFAITLSVHLDNIKLVCMKSIYSN
jgi:hypothetical protein